MIARFSKSVVCMIREQITVYAGNVVDGGDGAGSDWHYAC
jgi:hypothetical protein